MTRTSLAALLMVVIPLVGAGARKGPSGRVLDAKGVAVVGAKACLVVTGAEDLCAVTDSEGRYALPATDAVSIHVRARGFLPVNVAAVPQESPVVLAQAASIFIRVVDAATGLGINESKVRLVYSNGRQIGPIPANRFGVSHSTLPPGEIRAVATSEGYLEATGSSVTLAPGRKTEVVLKLTRAPVAPPSK